MTGDGATKRKRVKLQEGDLFEFVIPDGRLGYGIIVKRGARKNGGNPYVAVFNSAHRTRPDLSDVTSDEVALAGWTMDALIYHGQWNVIARDLAIPIVPFPNFQVEMG